MVFKERTFPVSVTVKKNNNLAVYFAESGNVIQLNAKISAVHSSAFLLFFKQLCISVLSSVCCALLQRQGVSHTFHQAFFCCHPLSFWFDQDRRKNIFLVDFFFHHFISVSRGSLHFFFPLRSHFASGGTTRLQISGGNSDRYYSVSMFSQKHMRGERAHVAPNKHLSSLCLRPTLKWDRDVVCKWTTSQN